MMQPDAGTTGGDTRNEVRRFAWAFGAVAFVLVVFLVVVGTEWRDAMKSVLARAGKLRAVHYGQWGVWWGCAVDAVVCVVLALTARWWAGGRPASRNLPQTGAQRMTRGTWFCLAAILIVAGALR